MLKTEGKNNSFRRWLLGFHTSEKLMGDAVFVVLEHTTKKRYNKFNTVVVMNVYKILLGDQVYWVELPNDNAWKLVENNKEDKKL